MKEHDIRNPKDLDDAILMRARSMRAKLESTAEGGSMSFSIGVMLLVSLVMLGLGILSVAETELGSGVVPALLGTVFLLSALVMRLEAQLRAIRELQRQADHRMALLEKSLVTGNQ